MKKPIILYIWILILLITRCRKKPDEIVISVTDPFLSQPIPNAKVGLIEQNLNGGLFSARFDCTLIQTVETDSKGEAVMTNAKLKSGKSFNYFLTVINAYNKDLRYSCANYKPSDFLPKTNKRINKTMYAYADKIDWQFVFHKLNSNGFGSDDQDSISIRIYRDFPDHPDFDDNLNGSKNLVKRISLNKTIYQSLINPSNPETYSCCIYNFIDDKIFPGKYKIDVFKRKNGVITAYSYQEAVSPFTDKYFFNLDW